MTINTIDKFNIGLRSSAVKCIVPKTTNENKKEEWYYKFPCYIGNEVVLSFLIY